ncbi:MAG: hypothetical protein R3359_07850 [Marinirhabdus sp.]|nr:hypothetical protein [Marinirhabdus sp.]
MMKHLQNMIVLGLALVVLACNSYGEKVEYNGTEVYYSEDVSKAIADEVGAYLVEMEFADGSTKSVQITKDSLYNFRMVTQEKYHNDTSMDINFQALGMLLSQEVFDGEPITFVICDNTFQEARSIQINGSKLKS